MSLSSCYLPPLAIVIIKQDGFCLHGKRYHDVALQAYVGTEVMLFPGKAKDTLSVCLGSELICIATVQRMFS
jgi:hypothetical protein